MPMNSKIAYIGERSWIRHAQGLTMSAWRRLLEEESEHQWLSFVAFTVIIISGAVLIEWSNELSGVHEGGQLNVDGQIVDSAGNAILYETENGINISLNGKEEVAPYGTCLVQHGHITFACLGQEGLIWFTEEDHPEEWGWIPMSLGRNITASLLSPNDLNQLLVITQDGTSNSIAAMEISAGDGASPSITHEGDMHLEVATATEDGWLVGGSWQAPANWLGSNPASPPMFELVLSVTWDGINAPSTEIIHMGDEGIIHGIFAAGDSYIATGTSDTLRIENGVASSMGMASYAAIGDLNEDVWLFGGKGSTSVAIISEEEISIEKLPEPLSIMPTYVVCDDKGLISIHGIDGEDKSDAVSIDSNARKSFLSLRGIIDLGFILGSILIIGMMGWNITDAIRKGEIF